jgi:hypothetical protein
MVTCKTPGRRPEKRPLYRQARARNFCRRQNGWGGSGHERAAIHRCGKGQKGIRYEDAIQRAINKGAGIGDEKLIMEHVVYEGKAPHNVPVIVEVYTDNVNRTAPEIRVLFKKGQLATTGANKFLFDHVGLVEAHHPDGNVDREAAAIEAGANDFEALTHEQNDDIPAGSRGREVYL